MSCLNFAASTDLFLPCEKCVVIVLLVCTGTKQGTPAFVLDVWILVCTVLYSDF